MHQLPDAPPEISTIFLVHGTMVIGANFWIGYNNQLLTNFNSYFNLPGQITWLLSMVNAGTKSSSVVIPCPPPQTADKDFT